MLLKIRIIIYNIWKAFNYGIFLIIAFINKIFRKNKTENSNKKIMILVDKICKGGAERAAINVGENLAKKYDVVIVLPQVKEEFKKIEQYNCGVKCVEIKGSNKIKVIKKIKQFKKENKITHCISFGTRVNFINVITRVNDKTIISIRNYLSIAEKDSRKKIKYKFASILCDYIVSVSKAVEQDQIKKYNINPNKICTIPNYCNKEEIINAISSYEIDEQDKHIFENGKVIINVGKLKFQKGQWHLIRAFKKVVEKNNDVKLIILGMGELEDYLKKLIIDLQLEKNVFILGHKNKNIYTYMSKSNIFVFPTLYEGMPNVILEAMACNLPIIASDCYGGNREIIAPNLKDSDVISNVTKCEYGVLLPKFDMKLYEANEELTKEEIMLANSINEMLQDNNLLVNYKEKSKERKKKYNKENYFQLWEEVLEKLQ